MTRVLPFLLTSSLHIAVDTPAKGRGGCSGITVSPTALGGADFEIDDWVRWFKSDTDVPKGSVGQVSAPRLSLALPLPFYIKDTMPLAAFPSRSRCHSVRHRTPPFPCAPAIILHQRHDAVGCGASPVRWSASNRTSRTGRRSTSPGRARSTHAGHIAPTCASKYRLSASTTALRARSTDAGHIAPLVHSPRSKYRLSSSTTALITSCLAAAAWCQVLRDGPGRARALRLGQRCGANLQFGTRAAAAAACRKLTRVPRVPCLCPGPRRGADGHA